jgi:hypothetical protein
VRPEFGLVERRIFFDALSSSTLEHTLNFDSKDDISDTAEMQAEYDTGVAEVLEVLILLHPASINPVFGYTQNRDLALGKAKGLPLRPSLRQLAMARDNLSLLLTLLLILQTSKSCTRHSNYYITPEDLYARIRHVKNGVGRR